VTALIRMRLIGHVLTGRFVAPLLTSMVVLGTLYGGGRAQAGEAYGVSALVLFPVLAWQAKLLLYAEPDVQRRLALVATGSAGREQAAGLLAAVVAAIPVVGLGLALPWLLFGVETNPQPQNPTLASGIAVGLWAHLVIIPPAIVLGALASRAVTRSFGLGSMVLVSGAVLTIVLGLRGSPIWWLVPPVMSVARASTRGFVIPDVAVITTEALVWTGVAWFAYTRVRRARA
jgi:hypothetical protein